MKSAFYDELEKISGEMQGFTRSGRKPISVEKMLENEADAPTPSEAFAPQVTKTSSPVAPKTVAALLAGAGTYHVARRANEDRKLGRQVRLQQTQGY